MTAQKNYFATIWVLVGMLLVFALQNLLPFSFAWPVGSFDLRFFLSMVSHGSVAHLLSNTFALLLFGGMTEGLVGTRRMLIVLSASAAVGNLAGIGTYNAVLGISGGVYGMIGILAMLRPTTVVWIQFMPMPMILAAVVYACTDLLGLFVPSNTGHLAHLAGLVVGLAFGWIWRPEYAQPPKPKRYQNKSLDRALDRWESVHMR